ncbi:reverse transcriptase [Gossypium australe]|uniref:Reverse transcriptase n=1 Tax=Gossypium australe TaxID=47621 RepID=A0A5B6X047_9ROSI|nr:reverse transcriptase [Gossypium australe]
MDRVISRLSDRTLKSFFFRSLSYLLKTLGGRWEDQRYSAKMFQFEAKWCLDSSFEDMIQKWWDETNGSMPHKLESLSRQMQSWSKIKRRDETKNRVGLEERLSYLFNQDISDENLAEIAEVQLGLNLEADKEELFWEHRARVNWLKNGDQNTSFFHKTVNQRQFRGRISELHSENGDRYTSSDDILKLAKNYFENLFTAPDVSRYCLGILNGQLEVGEINKTRIVLIPKVEKPTNMSQFRPISLCNVVYKIVVKVLVNRVNNVLIAYEVLHLLKMKKRGKRGNFALKLDMSKAYDRVEWDFLAGMMKHLGFHDDWIVLLIRCVCSVSYFVCLNNRNSEWFFPSGGLRQGDPLSPYLFLICAEGFSTLLQDAKQKGYMAGAPIGRERFSVNHLFFTDDCIFFGYASGEGARVVRDVIQEYEMISGQRVNYDKSLIYFGANVENEIKADIINLLGVRVASSPEKYLGLPMMVGRRKTWAFANFVDRFRKRVEGWSFCYLSMGGKEVFIKSVLQATPIYAMQCFLFPKGLCRKLESIMNNFWWSNNKTLKGIHWSCWETLCKPKCKGGIGFKNLFLFNKALLAKQVWRILTQPHCLLARVLKARYFSFLDILSAKVRSYPSLTWRSKCNARDLIDEGVLWRVGTGDRINIWNDPWLPGRENNRIVDQDVKTMWATVNQLIETTTGTWNRDLINHLFDETTATSILVIPISRGRSDDSLAWKHEGSGEYTVKSGYKF